MIFTPSCPLCSKTMVFVRDEPGRVVVNCPTQDYSGYNSHYIWFAYSFEMHTANLKYYAYYFSETFIVGNYRVTNKINSADKQNYNADIECCIYKLLPEPLAGTDYKVGAGLICTIKNRIIPTTNEKRIQTYITFS